MKRFKKLMSGILSATMMLTGMTFITTPTQAATFNEQFYEELSNMVNSQDTSDFFGSMQMTIGSTSVSVDGKTQANDVPPVITNNRTMLPIRVIAETAGADVSFNSSTRTVSIQGKNGESIECTVGANQMTINGSIAAIDSPSFISDSRTYLPVRAVSEALNLDVNWDQDTRTVTLTSPYQTSRLLSTSNPGNAAELHAIKIIDDGNGLWVMQFQTPMDAKNALDILKSKGVSAEPDYYIPPPVIFPENDVSLSSNYLSWGVEDCSYDDYVAQNKSNLTKETIVAVIDTGVDYNHPFLKGRILNNQGYDFIDNDSDAMDFNRHGTHVASSVLDCIGDAPVKILPVRVLGRDGSGSTSVVVSGIKYATSKGVDVISMSLGGRKSSPDIMDSAIQNAVNVGITVVVAAGNESTKTDYKCPAHINIPGVIVVSAGDISHNKADFTNYGSSVDLMAPGVDIKGAVLNNGYAVLSGTSMATPHISALAALIDCASGKTMSPSVIEQQVRKATASGGSWQDNYYGCGFVDLAYLLDGTTPPPSEDDKIVGYRYNLDSTYEMEVGDVDFVKVYAVYDSGKEVEITSGAELQSSNPSVATISSSDGTLTALKAGTTYVQMNRAYDSDFIDIPDPITVKVTESKGGDPGAVLDSYVFTPYQTTLDIGDTVQLKVEEHYTDGTRVDITNKADWYSEDESIVTVSSTGKLTAKKAGEVRVNIKNYEKASRLPEGVDVIVLGPVEGPDDPPITDPKLERVEFSKDEIYLEVGETDTIKVIGYYSNGSSKDITKESEMKSSDTSVATVSSTGTITGKGGGKAYITIDYIPDVKLSGVELPDEYVTVYVEEPDTFVELTWGINGAQIVSNETTIKEGTTLKVNVLGITTTGKVVDLTEECQLKTGDTSVATITSSGLLRTVGKGETYVTIKKAPNVNLKLPPFFLVTVN